MSLIRRNHNNDNIIPYIIKTERFNPGIIRNVSKFIFFSDCFLDFFPFFLDILDFSEYNKEIPADGVTGTRR